MTYPEFMGALTRGPVPRVALLAGEESYYIDRARRAFLARILPEELSEQDAVTRLPATATPQDTLDALQASSLFSPVNIVLAQGNLFREGKKQVAEDAPKKKDKSLERLIEGLMDMPEGSYLIFQMGEKPDKRKKLFKAVAKAGLVLEAEPVRAWNIGDWLQGKLRELGKSMDAEARVYFGSAVSMMKEISLEFLDKEFDKLALYSTAPRITKAELETVFSALPEVSVFALNDAVSERDAKKALTILRRELADGIYFTVILATLVRHVRQLWQAVLLQKQGVRGKALAKPLDLNPFIAERLGKSAARFDEVALKKALLLLIDADYKLKSGTAGIELLEYAIIVLCQK